jgi:hypothetical protein
VVAHPEALTKEDRSLIESSVERSAPVRTLKEDQASSYPPWKQRVFRGIALWSVLGEEIEPQGRGVYSVPSCTTEGVTYTVDLAVFGGEESCTCPAKERLCKHLVAATIHRAKARAAQLRKQDQRHRFTPEQIEANLTRMGAG